MSHQLINLSPDLKKLSDEGFSLEIRDTHVLVHDIPYVNSNKEIQYGTMITSLTIESGCAGKPTTHVMHFSGEQPCNIDGSEIVQIKHTTCRENLTGNIISDRSFSNKPQGGYSDYYEKFSRYILIVSAPAKSIDGTVKSNPYKPVTSKSDDVTVFNYLDTNASRAGIAAITSKVKHQKIAIIGLGGTGSYILDLVAKTPVKEIHLYDGDDFVQHNAFRCPGATALEDLQQGRKKVDHFNAQYSQMRSGIFAHAEYITSENITQLHQYDFVFISVDNGAIKELIFNHLTQMKISFIDVGIGIQKDNDKLSGILRTTAATPDKHDHLSKNVSFINSDENEYTTNIQLPELNSLNASFAVIKWKKLSGIYHDHDEEYDSTYTINANMLLGSDYVAA